MIGVRKMLDFVFTQHELKILDDVMPDHAKQEKHAKKESQAAAEAAEAEGDKAGLMPNASSGNVAITLANGNVLKVIASIASSPSIDAHNCSCFPPSLQIPVDKFNAGNDQCSINISEQLAKSSAWKTIDQQAHLSADSANGLVTTIYLHNSEATLCGLGNVTAFSIEDARQ